MFSVHPSAVNSPHPAARRTPVRGPLHLCWWIGRNESGHLGRRLARGALACQAPYRSATGDVFESCSRLEAGSRSRSGLARWAQRALVYANVRTISRSGVPMASSGGLVLRAKPPAYDSFAALAEDRPLVVRPGRDCQEDGGSGAGLAERPANDPVGRHDRSRDGRDYR